MQKSIYSRLKAATARSMLFHLERSPAASLCFAVSHLIDSKLSY